MTALDSAGLDPGEKYKPTDDNYCVLYLGSGGQIGLLESIEYTMTGSGRFFGSDFAGVITLDENGLVTSID